MVSIQDSAERKQVTVLFADVNGSMELQEQLDVEAWAAVIPQFVNILASAFRGFGATFDKSTGDGIMAPARLTADRDKLQEAACLSEAIGSSGHSRCLEAELGWAMS